MTSYTPISALPVVVGSLDPSSYLEVSVPDALSSTGYTSYRATPNQIGSLASGFVPTSRRVDTIPAEGLTGGGELSSDLTLRFSAVNMPVSSAMVIADTFVINNSGTNTPYQVTFANAMKALTGLSVLSIPDLTSDYLVINHAADGSSYKVSPSSLGLAAGNMPAGGTTGQSLIKRSDTDYDTEWSTGSFSDQASNTVFAGPTSGPNAQPSFRALVAADLPDPTTSAKGGVEAYNAVSHQFLTSISTSGVPASAQPAFTDISGTATVSQGGTGATTLTNHGILLGQDTSAIVATAVMTDGQLLIGQSAADPSPTTVSGDVTISSLGVTAIGNNKVTNAMIRQSAALSVIGNSTAALANVADISGTADQVLRVAAAGASMGFGSIDLSKSAAVGTSVLPVANGGTNIASYTAGDIIYASGATTLAKLADVATGNALISGGVGVAPSWGKIGLTTHVSGTLPIANGGTGQTTASAAFDALSPVTTRGDLIYRNATTNARLAIGSANTVLRTNGTDPSWGSVVLTTDVSGILPVANGGTGASAFSVNGILYGNNTSAVQVTAAGTTGQVLAGVTATSPTFEDISTVIDSIGSTQGQILYRGASTWSALAVGTSGQVLATQGAAANPHWIDVAGTGTVTSIDVSGGTTGLTTSGGPVTTAGTITIAGTLGTANGGTNLTSYTQGDMLYASSSSVISKLAKDTNATRYLSNTGGSNNPAWAQVNLANGVSGNLPVGNLNSGTSASALTFWRGDGSWSSPAVGLVPGGRLTLTSATPVMAADSIGATIIYYAPYISGFAPIYDGTAFNLLQFTSSSTDDVGLTVNLASSANWASGSVYDWFVINDGGTIRLASGPAWTSTTARGTGAGTTELQLLYGVWTNKVSMTARYGAASTTTVAANEGTYVGTTYMTGNGATGMSFSPAPAAGGTANVLGVWNAYNRVTFSSVSRDSTDTWSYTTASWRSANGNTANRVTFINGLKGTTIRSKYVAIGQALTGSGQLGEAGVGYDSTSSISGGTPSVGVSAAASQILPMVGVYEGFSGLGLHYVQALEYGPGSGSYQFLGDGGDATAIQMGLWLTMEM